MADVLVTARWSSDRDEDRFVVENPADGSTVALVQGAGAAEVDQAVRAALAGFELWSRRPAAERGACLTRAAEHTADTLKEFGYTKTLRLPLGDGEIKQWDAVGEVYR